GLRGFADAVTNRGLSPGVESGRPARVPRSLFHPPPSGALQGPFRGGWEPAALSLLTCNSPAFSRRAPSTGLDIPLGLEAPCGLPHGPKNIVAFWKARFRFLLRMAGP